MQQARVYVPNVHQHSNQMDFMARFSDNLNNDLLANTLSSGFQDSNKAYKDAGLTLQNHIINKHEIDQEGRKLIEEYDQALENTQEVEKDAEKSGVSQKKGNWGEPEERRLTQVVVPQPVQPVMMNQPQYVYNPMSVPQQAVYTLPSSPTLAPNQSLVPQNVPTVTQVASPIASSVNKNNKTSTEIKKKSESPFKSSEENTKKSIKTTTDKDNSNLIIKKKSESIKNKNRFLWWRRRRKKRRRRRRRRHHRRRRHRWRWGWRRRRPSPWEILQRKKRRHKRIYGHSILHNKHRVGTQEFKKHNAQYYKDKYHHKHNPYHLYISKKVRNWRNKAYLKRYLLGKLRKAKIGMYSREKFDRLREYKVKYAAELWTRTFIYDSVLMIERGLYSDHRNNIDERMADAEQAEHKATKDIEEFYNKYYGKDPEDIKAEDLVHHIFVS